MLRQLLPRSLLTLTYIGLFIAWFCPGHLLSQSSLRVDSLKKALKKAKKAQELSLYIELGHELAKTDPAQAQNLVTEIAKWAKKEKSSKAQLEARLLQGYIYYYKKEYSKFIAIFRELESKAQELLEQPRLAQLLHDVSKSYVAIGQKENAAVFLQQSQELFSQLNEAKKLAEISQSLASIYLEQNQLEEAKSAALSCLQAAQKEADKKLEGTCLLELGKIYAQEEDSLENAVQCLQKAISLSKAFPAEAFGYEANIRLGQVYIQQKKYDQAVAAIQQGLEGAQSKNDIVLSRLAYSLLTQAYEHLYHKTSEEVHHLEEVKKEIEKKSSQTVQEKEKEIEQLSQENLQRYTQLTQKTTQLYLSIAAIILFVLLSVLLFFSYREKRRIANELKIANQKIQQKNIELEQKRKEIESAYHQIAYQKKELEEAHAQLQNAYEEIRAQNEQLEEANSLILEQNRAITESIQRAQCIQEALLSSHHQMQKALPHSFVFFKPQNIVSGDFYWLAFIKDLLIIAVADCTGHGVPGALLAMLGTSFLNRIIHEKGITQPAGILNCLNLDFLMNLNQLTPDSSSDDGMEIALCTIDTYNCTLTFAGAKRPLFIVRNNSLLEYKNNNFSIGRETLDSVKLQKLNTGISVNVLGNNYQVHNFKEDQIPIEPGDMLYLFSDGFVDQKRPGKGDTRYKTNRFKQFLVSIASKSTSEQLRLIEQEFENFRGEHKQVDDVLVMGLRI
ncbi:MAG: SpoIIE family protein phosphatase [Bacteroidia bacterium]|nr:SpoIIE family protein phosphatase [Bacteroidia bacterium]MDW8158097.1 SpoIIE family protein phosphatase [Bacteroidia bacterium]